MLHGCKQQTSDQSKFKTQKQARIAHALLSDRICPGCCLCAGQREGRRTDRNCRAPDTLGGAPLAGLAVYTATTGANSTLKEKRKRTHSTGRESDQAGEEWIGCPLEFDGALLRRARTAPKRTALVALLLAPLACDERTQRTNRRNRRPKDQRKSIKYSMIGSQNLH